jgi:hypothetical protein
LFRRVRDGSSFLGGGAEVGVRYPSPAQLLLKSGFRPRQVQDPPEVPVEYEVPVVVV